jgi:hypothetical protein
MEMEGVRAMSAKFQDRSLRVHQNPTVGKHTVLRIVLHPFGNALQAPTHWQLMLYANLI